MRARLLCELVLCVSRAVLSVVLGAWSVRFFGWADWVDCRCFLSFVFLAVARRSELSPCNTALHALYHLMACPIIHRYIERGVHPFPLCGFPLSLFCNYHRSGLVISREQRCWLCSASVVHPLLQSEVPLPVKGTVEAVVPLPVPVTLPRKNITPYCKGPFEALLVRGTYKGYTRGYCP